MTKVTEKVFHDNWWIEYIEGEFDPSTKKDLALFLKNSTGDQAAVESLEWTKSKLWQSDDVVLPEDGLYYDDLHAKIMAAVCGDESGANELQDSAPESAEIFNVVSHQFGAKAIRPR